MATAPSPVPTPARGEKPAGDLRVLRRLVRWLAPYKRMVAAQLALMAVVSGLQVLQPLLVRHAIDVAIPQGDVGRLWLVSAAFLGLLLLELGTRHLSLFTMMITGQGVVRDIRQAVFRRMARLDQATFDRTPVGRLMVRATSDVEALEETFSSGVVAILGDAFKLVMLLGVMLALDARLTLVALAITPAFVVISTWARVRIRDAYRAVRRRLAELNAYLQEVIVGVRVVRLFAQEDRERLRFRERSRRLLDDDLRSVRHDSAYSSLVEMLASLAVAAVVWQGGGSVVQGAITFGTLFAFIEYAQQFFTPLQDLSQKYAVLQAALASSERVFDLLDAEDEIRSPARAAEPPEPRGDLLFDRVTFAYGSGAPVLRDVSFHAAPGRRLALVGATGSGKTTITRLILRLHDLPRDRPEDADVAERPGGAVRLDGVDVRDYPLDVLRRRVGLVLQEPYLFSGTVRESLFADADDERTWDALEAVGAAEAVRRLGGLDGAIREGGSNLSSGERQLLTLARALLHDPAVLVLDEATAAVDSLTERRIQEALERVLEGRTSVAVAHRLSTVRRADEILVVHQGRIRERGRHEELVAAKGIYARLHRLQLR